MKKQKLIFITCIFSFCITSCADSNPQETNRDRAAVQEMSSPLVQTENWPQFRGHNASGIAAGQDLPLNWDVNTGTNIMWKTPIPGLGHSSPVVWGDRIFVTTTIGEGKEAYLKIGRYGESPDNPEDYFHHYKVFCLDRKNSPCVYSSSMQ